MDILEILKRDHKTLLDLLIKMETTSARAARSRRRLLLQFHDEFELYSLIKDKIFYPYLRQHFSGRFFLAAKEEHSIRKMIAEMSEQAPAETKWRRWLPALAAAVREYISKEEKGALEVARDLLNRQQGEELGRRAEEEKKSHVVEIF